MWSYQEALAWLYARQQLGIKLGLDKVRSLLHRLGDPQDSFQAVHVAGTNGKGTVTLLLADVLQRAGFRVGTTTSPHLIQFTERIQVDGRETDPVAVAHGLERIRPVVEELDADGEPPTFFEITTALAFLTFAQEGVDWAVVETGLGGRLDATNVLLPDLTIITNVERDHETILGRHPGEIAHEKAGVMKQGVPCVTGASAEALVVLKLESQRLAVPMSILDEDYHVRPDLNGMRMVRPGGAAHFDVAVAGAHQLRNAALVVAAVDALRNQGHDIPEQALQAALATTTVPGRLETLVVPVETLAPGTDGGVEILLDGAHNEAGAAALRHHLGHADWAGFHFIFGANREKAWQAILDQVVPLAAAVTVVPLRTGRTLDPEEAARHVATFGIPVSSAPDVASALRAAAPRARRILVAGSLYLVGEARAVLLGRSLEEIRGYQ